MYPLVWYEQKQTKVFRFKQIEIGFIGKILF